MNQERIIHNLELIRKELGKDVRLVAVTKTVGIDKVKLLKSLGVNDFGENRISASNPKISEVKAHWHFIGHLQSNKVKKVVEAFDTIQSVDSVGLAEAIDFECRKQKKKLSILIQVNIAKEPQKHGFREEEIEGALSKISKLENISLDGFMMMAPNVEPEQARQYFRKMKQLFDKHKEKYSLKILSMGMSNDYHVAIEEGSNMARIGSKLFS